MRIISLILINFIVDTLEFTQNLALCNVIGVDAFRLNLRFFLDWNLNVPEMPFMCDLKWFLFCFIFNNQYEWTFAFEPHELMKMDSKRFQTCKNYQFRVQQWFVDKFKIMHDVDFAFHNAKLHHNWWPQWTGSIELEKTHNGWSV